MECSEEWIGVRGTDQNSLRLIHQRIRFEISGNGSFAFLNSDGVYSSRGFIDIKWICSKQISNREDKLENE
ncbi:hypothetical protein E2I00_015367 [Balaenoptera physalus]|uniref:Uncharacterized protein n=1 Tax=Balaenoptera physalus TaxID=9770 RepID=A0A643CBE2_BALPH|nr:hypothetical protein E2I00_015367 [Balaenoptera physalus]